MIHHPIRPGAWPWGWSTPALAGLGLSLCAGAAWAQVGLAAASPATAPATVSASVSATQPTPSALSLDDALRRAAARSRQLVALEASASAARAMGQAAGQLPDPVLKLGVDNLPINGADRFNLTADGMTMRRIGVMQDLPGAAKRALRTARFAVDVQRAEAERLMALAELQRSTAQAWLDDRYAQATLVLLQRQREETLLQAPAADLAYRNGKGSLADVLMAQSALGMLDDRISMARRQADAARVNLVRWVGSAALGPQAPGAAPGAVGGTMGGAPAGANTGANAGTDDGVGGASPLLTLWQATAAASMLDADHLQQHPDMRAQRAMVDAALAEQRLAEANLSADWSVEATYQQRGPAFGNMVSFGVSIPLQLDRAQRQSRELQARQAQLAEAEGRYDEALRGHVAQVQAMHLEWRSGKERVARWTGLLLPLARQRVDAALLSYQTGKGDLGQVLAARRDALDARLQALATEQETARAWAQLHYLSPDLRPEPQATDPLAKDPS